MSQHHNPRMALTPRMREMLDRMGRARRVPMHLLTPEQARAAYAMGAGVIDIPSPHLARVENLHIPVTEGVDAVHVSARLYAPQGPQYGQLPALLYFHGGGFTIGSIDTHDALCRELARLAHCAVLSLNYRLAPEHPFPTAVDDAWAALRWLRAQSASLGLNGRLAVGGDSAGGTLAAVCALMARDAGLPLALQLLFYPGCGARQNTASHHRYAQGFVLDADTIRWFFGHYIAENLRDDWRFAPALAPEHSGLAPAWIGLAECDPLVDDGLHYADVLRMAGVAVDLELYRGVVHGFIQMGRAIPEARQAHQDAARALRQAFATDA